ncbi:MAG: prephenate dehydrogenase/arogenate dehydrogenase family protein [Butyrivibrio sp.]|nr:prephenate dehydrogenase/arogenate dehydrogenase family protein [Butyrivibrio sp.]
MTENVKPPKQDPLTCGFIGLGLIGGSIARALKERVAPHRPLWIKAFTPHRSTVEEAQADAVVDDIVEEIGPAFSDCDLIFLCAPVSDNNVNIDLLRPWLSEKTTLTDIGSVKTGIHDHIRRSGLERQFVGGHPMTGTERIGYRNSKAQLLENAYYILTKTPETEEWRVKQLDTLVAELGATPIVIENTLHDYITGAISHLPHVISASLVNLVRDSDGEEGLMKRLAAGGFKDITRISSSSPVMWEQICLTNRDNLLTLLDRYIESLHRVRAAIEAGEGEQLNRFFAGAREYRESFAEAGRGSLPRAYIIRIDIADEPGGIASVATLLSVNGINIKNIGIVHNREYERGTLAIEFHEEASMARAATLLKNHGYPETR